MKRNQGAIVSGVLLIVMGFCFLIAQFFPALFATLNIAQLWPLIPLGVGLCQFVGGLLGSAELLVPGTIVSGVGTILFYQNLTNSWHHWQFWLLVPCFVGIGTILLMLRSGQGFNKALNSGGPPLVIGLILYTVFAGFRSALFMPLLFIGIGIFILLRGRFAK